MVRGVTLMLALQTVMFVAWYIRPELASVPGWVIFIPTIIISLYLGLIFCLIRVIYKILKSKKVF